MNDLRRSEITVFTDKLRDTLKISDEIYIDLDDVVSKLSGVIEYDKIMEGASGKILKIAEEQVQFKIIVQKDESEPRKRFTIAHEIGHLFLHMGYIINPEKWKTIASFVDSGYYRFGYSEEENEANHFAASFLMPKSLYRKVAKDNQDSTNDVDVKKMADTFGLSVEAVVTRGRWLGIFAW